MFSSAKNKITKLSDLELVERYKNSRDTNYIAELYLRYADFVFAVSMKYFKDKQKSNDIVMLVFEKLIKTLTVQKIQNFKSWLYSVTRNECLLSIRDETGERKKEDMYIKEQETFMETTQKMYQEDKDTKETLLKSLNKAIVALNEEQQNCIKLFYLQEKCYKEIADETGYEIKKVKSYIQNGKRNLKKIMMEELEKVKSIILFLMFKSKSAKVF